jgi:SnoaL-like domain
MNERGTPVEVVRSFGVAWAAHDLEGAIGFLTEDALFDATGPAPDGTRCVGIEAVREAWRPIFEDTGSLFEEEETFGVGDRVIQLWKYSWEGGHVRGVDVFLIRGGKVAEKRSYVKG